MKLSIRSADPRKARALQAFFGEAGVMAAPVVGPEQERRAEADDVSLLDAGPEAVQAAIAQAHALAQRPNPPLARIALAPGSAPLSPEQSAAFDAVLDLDGPPQLVPGRIAAALRAGVVRWEGALRRATAARLGLAPTAPPTAPERPPRILCVGAPDPFFLALERGLRAAGAEVEATFSPAAAFDRLHEVAIDGLSLNAREDADLALSLCGALRRNSDLHHTPTMVMLPAAAPELEAAALRRGASQIVRPGVEAGGAAAWLMEDIARRRRERAEEAALRRALPGPPLATAPFAAHLERQAEAHHAAGRPLSLAAVRLASPPGASSHADPSQRRAFREAASLLARMVRVSDCAGALDPQLVVIALPATREAGAREAAVRAAAVGECTSFMNDGGAAGPLLFDVAVAELHAGESGPALLARAISRLAPAAALA